MTTNVRGVPLASDMVDVRGGWARCGRSRVAVRVVAAACLLSLAALAPVARAACPATPPPPPVDKPASAARVDSYLRAVARSSPVVTARLAGRSVEGRPIRYAVVSALPQARLRAGLARLRAIRAGRAREPGDAPAVVWVAGSVHGNEPSGADADLRLVRELARRCEDPVLRHVVVAVMPVQNPDGHDALTRYNANGFDLNRDWLTDTQPETDARLRALLKMPPLVYDDQHEQGGSAFFFPPYTAPLFHELPAAALAAEREVLAPALRAAFASHDYQWESGKGFDLLYPGYGDSATTLMFGAAGMTLEAGAGHPYARRVREHLLAARTIVDAVAGHRAALLRAWAGSFAQAERQGAHGALQHRPEGRVYGYALGAAAADATASLVRLLRTEGVRVRQLRAPVQVARFRPYGAASTGPATLPAGTYLVPAAQPLKHWVQALLGPSPLAGAAPVSDVSAWSRPLLMGVQGGTLASPLPSAPAAGMPPAPKSRPLAGRRVALLADPSARAPLPPGVAQPHPGTSWARWVLADRLGAQVDLVDGTQIAAGALAGHGALVVADGSPITLPPAALQAIAAFVTAGGAYVGWRARGIQVASAAGLTAATVDPTPPAIRIPGVAARVGDAIVLDDDDPLIVGGHAVASYGAIVSGWASGSPAGRPAIVDERPGAGRAVLFAFDPTFRASTEGAEALLTSALLATPGAR